MTYFKLPNIRVHILGFIFSPGWIPTIFTVVFLFLTLHLGMWQLHRAQEKKQIEKELIAHKATLKMSQLSEKQDKHLKLRTIEVTGRFDNDHVILLDNRIYHHQIGYHVFTPFSVENDKRLLFVNRGFIPSASRNQLPILPRIEGQRKITGLVYFPCKAFVLKKEHLAVKWPLVVEATDLKYFRSLFHQTIFPFYLLLQKGEDSYLVRDWQLVNFPASRHIGYAIQWFSLALTLLIIYVVLNISRVDK